MLAYDRRGGDGPGLHALIVGVSLYDHLKDGPDPKLETHGIGQLSRAARTAVTLAELLVERADKLVRPLKTCRLHLSPTPDEAREIGACLKYGSAQLQDVQAAILEWHQDAAVREDDGALFFFCGHGIQQSVGSSYLLLQDFLGGAQPLDRALYLLNVYNGMRNGQHQPNMARTQIYLIDACRNSLASLADFEDAGGVQPFMVRRGGVDDRIAPIFFSSAPGHNAWSPDPNGPTLFGGQLISCLSGGAAEKRLINGRKQWVVSVADLAEGLSNLAARFNRDRGLRIQTFAVDHQTDIDVPIHYLDDAPTVDLVLGVSPEDARILAEIQMAPPGATPLTFGPPIDPLPYRCKVTAGTYALHVALRGNGGTPGFAPPPDEYIAVKGPAFEHVVSMSPL
jgi:hypothetical protein